MKQIKKNPMYRYLLVLTVASAAGLHGWRTLFNNFAVEGVGLSGLHVGVVQAVREVPGFLALCAVFLIMIIKEHRLSAISVMCMGVGIVLTGIMPSFTGLVITTLLMSFGFHYFETTNQSLILQYFDEYQSPLVMGNQRSMMSVVCIIIGIGVFFLSHYLSYKSMFCIIGSLVCAAGIWGLCKEPITQQTNVQHKKMILRKKYGLYYLLTFLSGARRQIFIVFSVLLLVQRFHFTIQQITILFVLNNSINYFVAPLIAKAIKRFGERPVLRCEYGALIVIFIAYALCPYKWCVAILYVCDHITFNGSMAIRTYFHKIAKPADIAATTAVSTTINHIAAVLLPVIGGFLWMINYRVPFFAGACIGCVSLVATQFVRPPALTTRASLSA